MNNTWEEEEEDDFHDSVDRLLSSSNTSCSCSPYTSEPEEECDHYPNHSPENYNVVRSGPVPKFPMGMCRNYDVWASEPLSVEDRRFRLLHEMGLSKDPSLTRNRPVHTISLSPDHLKPGEKYLGLNCKPLKSLEITQNCVNSDDSSDDTNSRLSGIVRSKSDGNCASHHSSELHSDDSVSASPCNNCTRGIDIAASYDNLRIMGDSPESNSESLLKIGVHATCDNLVNGSILVERNGGLVEGLECNGMTDDSAVCMIKNLNTGKKFVVNEVREDGMWEKIKEVGTGRQFTMEEFSSEMSVGTSPIVQELMRRQNVEDRNKEGLDSKIDGSCGSGSKMKKRGSWLRNFKNVASSVAGFKDRRSSDERDTSSEKGGRRSSSATDDSQDVSFHGPERVRVRQYGKSVKEFTALYKSQEIQAHRGSIWAIKFSLDGRHLASAGEDCVVHVWQIVETEKKEGSIFDRSEDGNLGLFLLGNVSPEPSSTSPNGHLEKKRRWRSSASRQSISVEQMFVPDTVFSISEKPICSLQGHSDDVLDLSWSKSKLLLSSSMDKTVRLWDFSSKCCLKIFSHSDYVTCIQFNPVDDRYFISGSLDAKVRIWSIPDRQVVDWSDLHEMVTAACYTPDGQGALVGSYKGSCHIYNASENKLQIKGHINLQNNKKSHQKKITGFQFAPGSTSEVLVTSADSRIRVVDGGDVVRKFKGFRNTHSQISASLSSNGKYVISASEDSHVYIWKHEFESQPNRSKSVSITQSYELFHCQDVSVAIPWPVFSDSCGHDFPNGNIPDIYNSNTSGSPLNRTWSENSSATKNHSPRLSVDYSNGYCQNRSALGMVIVTAGLRGEIRTFQNFGFPSRI